MKRVFGLLFVALALNACSSGRASNSMPANASPVLIELFTSEGCSSCPPADALLQQLDSANSSGAQVVVLSEHVDYWNHDGWKDPYSSAQFTERQASYASRFRLDGPYTPQMVVDGSAEFVGSSSSAARQAIEKAGAVAKVPITISGVSIKDAGTLIAHVEIGPAASADVFVAIALNHAESQVLHGENHGRRLTHVAVVQSLSKVGGLEKEKVFAQDIRIKLPSDADPANLRVIAFIQKPGFGPVLGVAMQRIQK